jgi:hypothetical protein
MTKSSTPTSLKWGFGAFLGCMFGVALGFMGFEFHASWLSKFGFLITVLSLFIGFGAVCIGLIEFFGRIKDELR